MALRCEEAVVDFPAPLCFEGVEGDRIGDDDGVGNGMEGGGVVCGRASDGGESQGAVGEEGG